MKKKVMLLLCLLATINFAFAQKIKIDKKTDIVSVDETAAAKISETKYNSSEKQFVFTSLDGADSMTFKEVRDEIDNHYFEVSTSFNDKQSEINYETVNFSFNDKSIISNLIAKKYGFLTTAGINKQALNDFMEIPFESKKERLAKAKAKQAEIQAQRQALMTKYSPTIEKDSIIQNRVTGEVLGKILLMPGAKRTDANPPYYFKDSEGNVIANLVYTSSDKYPTPTYFINTYQGKQIILKPTLKVDDSRNNAIHELTAQGFWGTEKNAYKVWGPAHRQWLDETKHDNTARTDVQGVLTTKKGEKIGDGTFRIKFRQTPDGKVRKEGGTWLDLDGADTGIMHLYQDEKGKAKTKVYKAKDVQSFVVNRADGASEVYENILYEYTPSVISDGSLDMMKLGKSLLKKGKEKKEIIAYKNVSGAAANIYSMNGEYFLKKAGEDSVSKIDIENITDEMISLLSGCIEYQKNVLENREKDMDERFQLFVDDYNKCSK